MVIARGRAGAGIALGLALALVGPAAQGVGWSSHPVGEQSHPRTFQCFGDPPRANPDPLSPPCVPFWDGDNQGATAPGVTAGRVEVVLYNDLGVSGDLTKPWESSDEAPGHEVSMNGQTTYLVRTLKAQVAYFQKHYQTYGRKIRVVAVPSVSGITSGCEQRAADAKRLVQNRDPFAFTVLGDGLDCFVDKAAELGVPTIGFLSDLHPRSYTDHPGLVWSFNRDVRELGRLSAAFICDKLEGRRARLANDPLLKSQSRKIAVLFNASQSRGPAKVNQVGELLDALDHRCGLNASTGLILRPYLDSATESLAAISALKLAGVTTIVCYCVPVNTELDVTRFQTAATALLYSPEWYFDTASRMHRSDWHRKHALAGQSSFGITPEWRIVTLQSGFPYQAFKEQVPDGSPNLRFNYDIYHGLHLLFTAIQTAGPVLTVDSVGRGLSTHRLSGNAPWDPIGSLGRGGANIYTFQRGSLAWVWDHTGSEPGATEPTGCLRTPGHLTRDNHWTRGDKDLGKGQCMVSHVKA